MNTFFSSYPYYNASVEKFSVVEKFSYLSAFHEAGDMPTASLKSIKKLFIV